MRYQQILAGLSAALLWLASGLTPTLAEPPPEIESLEQLREQIHSLHEKHGSTALGIVVIDRGRRVWLDARGETDALAGHPVDEQTLFRIGSISKMFIGLSALKLVEQGQLSLDTPLRELAPELEFDNPWRDREPVRLVHLLEHTSGWPDMRFAEFFDPDEGEPIELGEALTRYPETRHSRWVPGTRMAYSNIGSAVAAHVIERVTNTPFEQHVQTHWFDPLGMNNATYFRPGKLRRNTAQPHTEGRPEPFWAIPYRPAGSIHASLDDMGRLVSFFLERGRVGDRALLTPQSIERMKTPHTTLGNERGITAGYGLTSYTSGFADFGVAFHGHNGGMPGVQSELAYTPELGGGYFISVTGNLSGLPAMTEAIRAFLLRDHSAPELDPPPLPPAFRELAGNYRSINPRQPSLDFLPDLRNAITVTVDDRRLHRAPMDGSWSASNDYALNEQVLISPWSGLPSVAPVTDPLAGEALQVDRQLYQKSSAAGLWAGLIAFVTPFALSALAGLYALVWLPLTLARRQLNTPAARLQSGPLLASAFLLAGLAVTASLSFNAETLAPWSAYGSALFGLTLAYGLAVLWGLWEWYRLRGAGVRRRVLWPATLLLTAHLAMALYLAGHGLIGVRLWAL